MSAEDIWVEISISFISHNTTIPIEFRLYASTFCSLNWTSLLIIITNDDDFPLSFESWICLVFQYNSHLSHTHIHSRPAFGCFCLFIYFIHCDGVGWWGERVNLQGWAIIYHSINADSPWIVKENNREQKRKKSHSLIINEKCAFYAVVHSFIECATTINEVGINQIFVTFTNPIWIAFVL